jgi:hypothetical protein
MRKLITRGLPAALAAAALLLTGAGTAFAGTPDTAQAHALGHANTPKGKAKGQTTPTPTPTTYYQRDTVSTVTYDGNLYGTNVGVWCDTGDYAADGWAGLNPDGGTWTASFAFTAQGAQGDSARGGWYFTVAPVDHNMPIGASVTVVAHATCVDVTP